MTSLQGKIPGLNSLYALFLIESMHINYDKGVKHEVAGCVTGHLEIKYKQGRKKSQRSKDHPLLREELVLLLETR